MHFTADVQASANPIAPFRRVYRHSVIAGGIQSLSDLAGVLGDDPVVRAHYAVFDSARLVMARLDAPRSAYVSYRIGDAVYWTRNPLPIPEGELVLTDGRNAARARCGNRLSSTPQQPVSAHEPPPGELDQEDAVTPLPPGSLRAQPPADVFPPFLRGMISPPRPPAGGPASSVATEQGSPATITTTLVPLPGGTTPVGVPPSVGGGQGGTQGGPSPISVVLPEPVTSVPVLGIPFVPYNPAPPGAPVAGGESGTPTGVITGVLVPVPVEWSVSGTTPPVINLPGPVGSIEGNPSAPVETPEPGNALLLVGGCLLLCLQILKEKLSIRGLFHMFTNCIFLNSDVRSFAWNKNYLNSYPGKKEMGKSPDARREKRDNSNGAM